MNNSTIRSGLWITLLTLAGAACQAPAPAVVSHDLTDADIAAVRAAWDALNAVGTDWDAVAGFLTEDFVHLDPRTGPISGIGAWRAWVESMEFGEEDNTEYTIGEISGSGDLAYVVWTYEGSWTEAGELVESEGKGISIYRRTPDGGWLLSRNAWNVTP